MSATSGSAADYWGYGAFAVAVTGSLTRTLAPGLVLLLAAGSVVFVLTGASVICGARTGRDEFCRLSSAGILGGCDQFRHHKWRRPLMLLTPRDWALVNRTLWSGVRGTFHSLVGLVSIACAVAVLPGLHR